MVFICSNCNKILNKVILHRIGYYICESCGYIIEKNTIYSALDKNIIKIFSYKDNKEPDKTKRDQSPIKLFLDSVIKHVENYEKNLEFNVFGDFIDIILGSNNIFIDGVGRSGLVGRRFIMKLTKLGLKSFAYCEISSPPIKRDDCLILLSGSGKTKAILESVKYARKRGVKILSLTNNSDSPLAKLSDVILIISGEKHLHEAEFEVCEHGFTCETCLEEHFYETEFEERIITGEYVKTTPMGTLFELVSMIILDGLIRELRSILNK